MPAHSTPRIYDGTTGGTVHSGRRTHIIQLLRDTKDPLSVAEVAETVGIHPNTARFHLESLVDAGLATRETAPSAKPGRRRVMYTGTLPNQTHERAQGYRLLSQILAGLIATRFPDMDDVMCEVGRQWGSYLTSRPAPYETLDEAEIGRRVMDKSDALWFAPELQTQPGPHLLFHNCPFMESARSAPGIICRLHGGMINGSLTELRSSQRVVKLEASIAPHLCRAWLGPVGDQGEQPLELVLPGPVDES